MSDRARSSVRTESREGSGTADEALAGAAPVEDRTESVAGTTGDGGAAAEATAGGSSAVRGSSSRSSAPEPTAVEQTMVPQGAPVQAPAPAATSGTVDGRAAAGTPAAAKTPAGKAAAGRSGGGGKAAAAAPVDDRARPVTSPAPPVPPATGTSRAVGAAHTRSGVPAAGSVPVDSTQAVTLPPAGARPASQPRPAEQPRQAEQVRTAGRPAGDTAGNAANAGKARGKTGRGPRRARLQLRHIDTWSALKISLVLSIALFFVWMVAVGILYGVLGSLGVFDSINELIGQVSSSSGDEAGSEDVINAGIVFGGAAVIGAINIVLLTALCTVGTFVYNLCSDLVGGLEVTLAERD